MSANWVFTGALSSRIAFDDAEGRIAVIVQLDGPDDAAARIARVMAQLQGTAIMPTILYESAAHSLTNGMVDLVPAVPMPTTGDLEITVRHIATNRVGYWRGPVGYIVATATRVAALGDGNVNASDIEVANRRVFIANINGNIALASQNNVTGDWGIRISHIE